MGLPLLCEAMMEACLQEEETYAARRQNTVVQYIVNRPIMELFPEVYQPPGMRVLER